MESPQVSAAVQQLPGPAAHCRTHLSLLLCFCLLISRPRSRRASSSSALQTQLAASDNSTSPSRDGSAPADAHPLSLASMSRMISSRWLTRDTSSWRSSCSLCCWLDDFCQSDRRRQSQINKSGLYGASRYFWLFPPTFDGHDDPEFSGEELEPSLQVLLLLPAKTQTSVEQAEV